MGLVSSRAVSSLSRSLRCCGFGGVFLNAARFRSFDFFLHRTHSAYGIYQAALPRFAVCGVLLPLHGTFNVSIRFVEASCPSQWSCPYLVVLLYSLLTSGLG